MSQAPVTGPVSVRRATAADADALVELRALMFDAMGTPPSAVWHEPARRWFVERVDDPSVGLFVVDADGRVASCAVGIVRDVIPAAGTPTGVEVALSNVCTYPWARGRGYARAVVDAVMAWGRGRGATRVELLATDQGRPLYESLGFVETSCPAMRLPLS